MFQKIIKKGQLGNGTVTRQVGKGAFALIRSTLYSVQGDCFESAEAGISKEMVKYSAGLPVESVVDVKGIIKVPDTPSWSYLVVEAGDSKALLSDTSKGAESLKRRLDRREI